MKWSHFVQIWIVLVILSSVFFFLREGNRPQKMPEFHKLQSTVSPEFVEMFKRDLAAPTSPQKDSSSIERKIPEKKEGSGAKSATENWPATVGVADGSVAMRPNSIGNYSRVTVPAGAVIPIHLHVRPGDFVQVQVWDGGKLDNENTYQTFSADSGGAISFNYEVNSGPGSYRVAVFHDTVREVFDFWVGPDLPQRVNSESQ